MRVLVVIEVTVEAVVHHQGLSIGCEWHAVVHSRVADQVARPMHIIRCGETYGYRSDLVSNLQVLWLARVRRVERLVVRKAVDVQIILLVDLLIALPICICFKAVKEAEEDLQSDETVRTGLMLRSHPHDVQLFRNFVKTAIQIKTVHERLDVEDIGNVVLEELFEELARRWQVLVHHDLYQEPKVLVTMEADPSESVVEDKAGCHNFFREVERINAMVLEVVEI